MSYFGTRINKTERPDKTPYTSYYPHSIPHQNRKWNQQDYYQVVSIDPGRKNYALRIERRYHTGKIIPIVFDKFDVDAFEIVDNVTICNTYRQLTEHLNEYKEHYLQCHFIIIERQLPKNYKATRIAQHTISYFSMILHNTPLLPAIIEVSPQLKGKMLGVPKGINDKQLKTWAVVKAREILTARNDQFSIGVLNYCGTKQDDLSDTVCQVEALFIYWGMQKPPIPVDSEPTIQLSLPQQKTAIQQMVNVQTLPITLQISTPE